jgi:hypothetical protein
MLQYDIARTTLQYYIACCSVSSLISSKGVVRTVPFSSAIRLITLMHVQRLCDIDFHFFLQNNDSAIVGNHNNFYAFFVAVSVRITD